MTALTNQASTAPRHLRAVRDHPTLRDARARTFYLWLIQHGCDAWETIRDHAHEDLSWKASEIDRACDDGAALGWIWIEARFCHVEVGAYLADDDGPLAYDEGEIAA